MIRNNLLKKPLPLSRAPDLSRLLYACGVKRHDEVVGGNLECPLCRGQSRALSDLGRMGSVSPRETFQIFPTGGNDFAMRCTNCGFAGNGLNLFWKTRQNLSSWESAIQSLDEFELFGDKPLDAGWVERGEAWSDFEPLFEKAKARMRGMENPLWIRQFGEIGVLPTVEFVDHFKWAGKFSGFKRAKVYLRLVRTIHGLPSYVAIDGRGPGMEFTRYYFNDPGPLEVAVPSSALYRDWSTELVVLTDMHTAVAYQNRTATTAETIGHEYAAMWILNCTGPIHEEMPARIIHYLAGPGESGEFALALCAGQAEVKIWKAEDRSHDLFLPKLEDIRNEEFPAIEYLVEMIVCKTESDSHAIAYLDSVLKKPWASPAISAVITAALSRRLGRPLDDLVRQMGAVQSILAFHGDKATYLSRNGLFLKTTDRGRTNYRPCSNFSLQIEESSTDGRAILGHSVQLRMGQMRTTFRIDDSDFQDGRKLMSKATLAALAANCPSLPNLTSPSDVELLPLIVRGTQSAPQSILSVPDHWGFSPGRFQGPDFNVINGAVHTYRSAVVQPACLSLLEREMEGVAPGAESEFMKFRTNEFAAWFMHLPPGPKGCVAVLLHTAMYWLYRGAGGGESFLALPTREYHSLFSSLVGIRPIEVGRARTEHFGVPRLMAGSYSSAVQFGRQGRIVAALEATDRRLENRVISLLHRVPIGSETSIEAPFSLLPQLAHGAASSRSIDEAEATFLQRIDDPNIRSELCVNLLRARDYLIPPGATLDLFLRQAGERIVRREAVVAGEEKKGMVLLKTETVTKLAVHGYHYDERRIADLLGTAHGVTAPIRNYGRRRIRVFQIPSEKFKIFEAAWEMKSRVWIPFGS